MRIFFYCFLFFLVSSSSFAQQCQVNSVDSARKVYIKYTVNTIDGIDYVAQTFAIDFYFQMWWKVDQQSLSQLLQRDQVELKENLIIPLKYLSWVPENDFINAQSIEAKRTPEYIYDEGGYILFDMRYQGVFHNEMDLKKFPFDEQDLAIELEDFTKRKEELVFVYGAPSDSITNRQDTLLLSSKDAFETELKFPEFYLDTTVKSIIGEHEYNMVGKAEYYSQSKFVLHVARETDYYLLKIISISCLIVIMSWIVFYMPPSSFNERSSYSITAFLALVGHNYLTNSLLPLIPYLTMMDYITMGTNLLVFFTLVVNLTVYILHKKSSFIKKYAFIAKTIDRICRWLFPLILLLLLRGVYLSVNA